MTKPTGKTTPLKFSTSELVLAAIFYLQQKNGVTAQDITKYICDKRGHKQSAVKEEVKRALERATENGIFSKRRGLYRIEVGGGEKPTVSERKRQDLILKALRSKGSAKEDRLPESADQSPVDPFEKRLKGVACKNVDLSRVFQFVTNSSGAHDLQTPSGTITRDDDVETVYYYPSLEPTEKEEEDDTDFMDEDDDDDDDDDEEEEDVNGRSPAPAPERPPASTVNSPSRTLSHSKETPVHNEKPKDPPKERAKRTKKRVYKKRKPSGRGRSKATKRSRSRKKKPKEWEKENEETNAHCNLNVESDARQESESENEQDDLESDTTHLFEAENPNEEEQDDYDDFCDFIGSDSKENVNIFGGDFDSQKRPSAEEDARLATGQQLLRGGESKNLGQEAAAEGPSNAQEVSQREKSVSNDSASPPSPKTSSMDLQQECHEGTPPRHQLSRSTKRKTPQIFSCDCSNPCKDYKKSRYDSSPPGRN